MKWALKKDCLADCNYDVNKYIINDNYYQLTKQFTKSPSKVRKDYLTIFLSIFVPTITYMIIMFIIGICYAVIYPHGSYLNEVGWILWWVGICSGLLIEISLLCWRLVLLTKYLKLFNQLIMMEYIISDYAQYPILIQNALCRSNYSHAFNKKNFWITMTGWWLYAFAVFFDKLNQVYLEHHPNNDSLIDAVSNPKK